LTLKILLRSGNFWTMQFNMRKILIISPGGIGDLIMFEPCLRILKNNFPDARISIFTGFTPVSGRVILPGGAVDKIIDFAWEKNSFFSKIRFIYKLRKEKYDLSIVTTGVNPFMGGLFSYLVGAKMRVGETRQEKKSMFYTHASFLEKNKHATETNINLLKAIGLKVKDGALLPVIRTDDKEKEFAGIFLKNNNLSDKIIIGFHPGCGENQKFRRWPKEYFVELGQKILYNFQYVVILIFGGPGEEEICESTKNELNGRAIAITKRSIKEAISLIEKCDLFVSSDSGLCHSAAALGVETISIFGPTDPGRTGPRGPNVHIIKSKCGYPYILDTLKNYDVTRPHTCLKKITPDIVFAEMEKKLNKNRKFLHNEQ
jgi:lipopolysaccharide heptosyltransferase II